MYRSYIKRMLDIVFAIITLPVVLLVCIVFGALIWLEDRGNIFYKAKRRGLNGRPFTMYKLRSMYMNSPDIRNKDLSTFNSASDVRVTRIGRILRKTSVDELPQILNILKGDMSWVGPRPITTERPMEEFDEKRLKRLTVRPGITGYQQAYYRNSIDQETKFELDAKYAEEVSFLMDVRIILKTIQTVVLQKNIYNQNNDKEGK